MRLTIALAQICTHLGDVQANLEKHLVLAQEAHDRAHVGHDPLGEEPGVEDGAPVEADVLPAARGVELAALKHRGQEL